MQELKTTTIEKLVPGGRGLGRAPDGMVTLVFNALPGEEVEFYVTKKKKNYLEANAEKILKSAPYRIEPKEPEIFLSTSPWQIITPEKEAEFKVELVQDTYRNLPEIHHPLSIVDNPEAHYGYRNKMEFSFTLDEGENLKLAFFKRGTKRKIPVTGSKLSSDSINQVAEHILAWLTKEDISESLLKSVVIRSNEAGEAIAALFIKEPFVFNSYPELDILKGFQVYESNPKSPASVPTKLLYSQGQDYLIEKLGDYDLKYGLLSFFQVNQPLFLETLKDIDSEIPQGSEVIDFYSGVGSIGIPLSSKAHKVTLIDINEEAITYAKENIALNNLENFEAICSPSEKITEVINSDAIVMVDPPRAGLHKKVVSTLLEKLPPKIIYLSCDLATQARDLELLSEHYKVKSCKLYNYFPRTPHTEALCVLELR